MSMTGDIGAQMKSARRSSGLTQDQLAEKLHVTRQTISSWENGRTQPSYEVLQAFAEAVGVPFATLWSEAPEVPAVPEIAVPPAEWQPRPLPWPVLLALLLTIAALLFGDYALWRISPKVNAPDLAWFQQGNVPVEGQTYLLMESSESPAMPYVYPEGAPPRYTFRVFLKELNGVTANIDRVRYILFKEEWFGHIVPVMEDGMPDWEMRQIFGSSRITSNSVIALPLSIGVRDTPCGAGVLVETTDENGVHQMHRLYVPFEKAK